MLEVVTVCVVIGFGIGSFLFGRDVGFRQGSLTTRDVSDAPPGVDHNSKGGRYVVTGTTSTTETIATIRGSRVFICPCTSMTNNNYLEIVPQTDGSTCIFLAFMADAWRHLKQKDTHEPGQ